MALGLSGPAFPQATVNDCLDQLVARVESTTAVDGVYGYRTMQTELASAAVVTAISDVLSDTPQGLRMSYDYIIDVIVRIDSDYETAERTLNTAVDAIWRAVWGEGLPYWTDCYPYAANQKPASPEGMTNWRRAILYVRVIPN